MAIQFKAHVVPMIEEQHPSRPPGTMRRVPKYHSTIYPGTKWFALDYGSEDTALLGLEADETIHALLTAESDVLTVPTTHPSWDTNPTAGQATTAANFLEGLNIPGNWIDTGDTWRSIIRVTGGAFQFNQRFFGLTGQAFFTNQPGVTLNTVYSSLPQWAKDAMVQAASDLSLNTAGLSPSSTIRQILKSMGDQFDNRALNLAGYEI